ncbi:MAG: 6-phosphogluconolactonase [Chloroflexi bacterium]|nr:6-phosphogluconolactonase [Chloroflexota bacterium]
MGGIRTFDAPDELTAAAADLVLDAARGAVRDRGRFTWCLAGGNTPAMLYRKLASEPYAARFPWDRTHVFWGDERWVPSDDPDNNAKMAREELLSRVPIPQENIRPIATAGIEPEASAAAAERAVRALLGPGLRPDLVLLGLGEDGHTASLFPGTTALGERTALFAANRVPILDAWRITATLPLLNAARHIAFLVTGTPKARALRQVLFPGAETMVLPASMVRPTDGKLTWLLDREAASLLPHTA